jgi:hypothetical protein
MVILIDTLFLDELKMDTRKTCSIAHTNELRCHV